MTSAIGYHEDIATKTIGYRTVMNTRFPVTCTIARMRGRDGKIIGYAISLVCNGTADQYLEFKTLSEAKSKYDSYGSERD